MPACGAPPGPGPTTWTAPGCRPAPGSPSACRTRSATPPPWSASSGPAGWSSRWTPAPRPPICPGCSPRPARPGGPGPGRGDLPVHERNHRRAQGHLATRGSTGPRRRERGRPPPAGPGGSRLLLSAAVPRQRRGGRIARDPRRGCMPGAGPQVQPAGILGADRAAPGHLDQRGSRDHRRAGHGPSRGPGRRACPLRPFGLRSAAAVGTQAVRGGVRHPRRRDLRDDGGGQHDRRQPAGRPAQGRRGGPGLARRSG